MTDMAGMKMNEHRVTKTCRECHGTFPREEFPPKGRQGDRRQPVCKQCYPRYLELLRERNRVNSARERERRLFGAPVERERVPMLPVEPLTEWIAGLRMENFAVAEWLGTTERQVFRWLSGESATTSLDMVDRCLCHAGVPWVLRELYPELFEFDGQMAA